jgi:hypothetical protein
MVWSEYVDQTRGDNDYSDDDGDDDFMPDRRLTIDDWTAWYSEDLLNMWFSLVQYREDSGRKHASMKGATYSDFCEFCYNFSHGFAA